jgi:hypothetical protein
MASAAEAEFEFSNPGCTPGMAPGPIGGPGAWRGSELAKRPAEWTYTLSPAEIGELDAAMRQSFAMPIIELTKGGFPLPTLGKVFDDMRRELLHGRGFFLIRGIPVRDYTIEESARVYYGLGAHFGIGRSQNAKGHVLGHVCDLGARYDAFRKPGTSRIYQTKVRQRFHTDSTDFVSLLCLQKSKSGGESSIASSIAVHDEMFRRDKELLAELYKPFWRDRRGEIPPGRKEYYPMAVYHWHEGLLSAIYARDYIESCERFPELPKLTEKQIAALDLFDSLVESREFRLDMAFEPGDVQMLHNHQILHARGDFEDWPEVERKRHLLRLWLCPPDGRPLPDSFEERYLKLDIGDRGGIVGSNSKLNAPLEPV